MSVDTVILAAGNGSRLKGVAATGMKPLLVVNGEALVSRLVRQVQELELGRVVVVTSPVNTQAICSLVGLDATYVVQPEPLGPGEALVRGLAACTTDLVLVLMGDNHMADPDLYAVLSTGGDAVGVTTTESIDVARRFTRLIVSYDGGLKAAEEGGEPTETKGPWVLWCGPLMLNRERAVNTLSSAQRAPLLNGELKIGPHLKWIMTNPRLVPVDVRDIGIAEELL